MEAEKEDLERIPDSISDRNHIFMCGTDGHRTSDPYVTEKLGDKAGADDEKCAESGQ